MELHKISSREFMINPFQRIGRDWMLVSAGSKEKGVNTLTACWGGLGNLWHKDAAFIFIRPTRYTYEFIESHDTFSLCFFNSDKKMKQKLLYLGNTSGRDENKIDKAGLHVRYYDETPAFDEANLVIVCKKIYHLDFCGDRIPENERKRFYSGVMQDR